MSHSVLYVIQNCMGPRVTELILRYKKPYFVTSCGLTEHPCHFSFSLFPYSRKHDTACQLTEEIRDNNIFLKVDKAVLCDIFTFSQGQDKTSLTYKAFCCRHGLQKSISLRSVKYD